ncbi:MAG TPA: DUF1003 domain-containing protein, partial [Trebonia sp.]|nr:DUF1003 domain-containing protein [Trebonia sp.]
KRGGRRQMAGFISMLRPRRAGDRDELSVPRGGTPVGGRFDADMFGRMSEGLARFLGTGRYLLGQTVLVIAWIVLNIIGGIRHWDPYPFILLNLAFSTQAAYAAPLILLAQNRQDDRDRISLEEDRSRAARDRQVVPLPDGGAPETGRGEPGHQLPPPVRRQPTGSSRSSTSSTVTAPSRRPPLSHTATPMRL